MPTSYGQVGGERVAEHRDAGDRRAAQHEDTSPLRVAETADRGPQERGGHRERADGQTHCGAAASEGVLDEPRQDRRDDADGDEVTEGGAGDLDERGRE